MGFNSGFKGLKQYRQIIYKVILRPVRVTNFALLQQQCRLCL